MKMKVNVTKLWKIVLKMFSCQLSNNDDFKNILLFFLKLYFKMNKVWYGNHLCIFLNTYLSQMHESVGIEMSEIKKNNSQI